MSKLIFSAFSAPTRWALEREDAISPPTGASGVEPVCHLEVK